MTCGYLGSEIASTIARFEVIAFTDFVSATLVIMVKTVATPLVPVHPVIMTNTLINKCVSMLVRLALLMPITIHTHKILQRFPAVETRTVITQSMVCVMDLVTQCVILHSLAMIAVSRTVEITALLEAIVL